MELQKRAMVTRGGILAVQLALLVVVVAAFLMRGQLGGATWLFAGIGVLGIVVLRSWRAGEAEADELDDAFRVAEESIKREAKRLDSRRAEIEKVLLAYGEWMEFPDFDELQNLEWATPERSAQDAEVAKLLDRESERVLKAISEGAYWKDGQLQTRVILLESWDYIEKIARIYNPNSGKPILETNLEELLKSLNRVSLQIILLLEEVPILDVKDWNLQKVSENVRKASKVVKHYEDLQPLLGPVRYLWQGSKFLLASNPLIAAGWIAGSRIVGKAGRKFGKRSLDAYLLSLLRQVLGIVAWETASIYDRTSRFRDPQWVFGVELAHLLSEFPVTSESVQGGFRELGRLSLRSSYDRIFLYRCVAQHVSPKPERFAQVDLLTEKTRMQIAEQLHEFFNEYIGDARAKKVAAWRKEVSKRLGVNITAVEA